ncbi:MAG TPA: glycosyltransferase, partial [Thermoanaerobaculia bacterium]|nr:glycosyltransferase [Thermoanaerobaculia bacterium]
MPTDETAGRPATGEGAVDVVLPVYRPGPELERCLDSVRRHTDLSRHRLVVVLEPPAHGAVAPEPGVLVLANERRLGFVGSVNRGLAASDNDVVLLNSDTQVTRGWVEKLRRAAYSGPRVATVSPFSNNATICSLPRFLEENTLPAGHDVDSFAALVERVSRREYPPLPTGVGVCLYVRRAAIDEVGGLDERSFGLGYGEESELCMRAAAAGWSHLLDDATFIFHEGQRSFGTSRRRRVAAAHRTMRRLHPDYLERIARFIAEDPLRPVRGRVLAALDPPRRDAPRSRVVHLVHGWPPFSQAGTELYAHWLVCRQLADREIGVYARIGDPDRWLGEARERHEHGARVRLVVNNFRQRDPISRNALHDRRLARDFGRFLDERRPDLVHVHHLAGHCASLLAVAARRGVPIVYQVQDWWPICARTNLLHRQGFLCGGPTPRKCADCLPMTRLPGAPLWNPLLYAARQRLMRRLLRLPDVLVTGSRFIAESYRHHRMLPPRADLRVLPYGVPLADRAAGRRRRPVAAPPLRFGYVGSIQPHKGVHLAADAFAQVDPARATLEVWGDAGANPAYTASLRVGERPAIALRGRFPEERKAEVLAALDVLLVPSVGLESFGLVVREA